MIKKILLFSLVVSQLTTSCSKSDDPTTTDDSLSAQVDNITKLPYSQLTPDEQKVKLEADANDALTQLDNSKNSPANGALDNLTRLLDINTPDIFNEEDSNGVEDILNSSNTGIYTWDNTTQSWTKSDSSSELKFVFPATDSQVANNASFSTKSTSTQIKDSEGNAISVPTSTNADLTIDGAQAATITQDAKYVDGSEVPTDLSYKMTLSNGYAWEMSNSNSTNNTAKANFTYNGKNLLEFNSGTSDNVAAAIDNPELAQYKGNATGFIKIMDNLAIVSQTDFTNSAIDNANLANSLPALVDYDNKDYYTAQNAYNLKASQGAADNYNKNTKAVLVSLTDGTKIADVIQRSEIVDSYSDNVKWIVDNNSQNGGYWDYDPSYPLQTVNYYDEVSYLKFNDNTEVEMSAYFSTGFDDLNNKFTDFANAFQK